MGIVWELDFYSRPIVDEQQKKIWELLVCQSPQDTSTDMASLFRYTQFCPSTQVNSIWLRTALESALAEATQPPDRIRFFRQPMANMITKACSELDIAAQPSRRTFALNHWLQQRLLEVYPTDPGYQPGTSPTISSPVLPPQALPEALVGQSWAFVNLTCDELSQMSTWAVDFGDAFPPQMLGLSPDVLIPGVVIFSPRALPMAGWMSGLDLVFLKLQAQPIPSLGKLPSQLILETGIRDRWVLASFTDVPTLKEARAFEAAKQEAHQVHFLAVQSHPQAETFAGFWLLQEVNLA
ncbi:hypothetical protein DO97_03815 [Neosynechococcus sphagnicola sy1]|uniref:DUF1092 family protein n=1 Tax=Neosynechococcus sphagnicola sy1 TaxID=1497020 RepID=A0A098TPV1_9CYAN|nr:Tab2/Atab2 family RNA-binding protein [Neosynechococcus sphagnicola]KGF72858.1 hypothetical protein DO97_03815 [Neosynechococcus sphagnicola sy1]